MSPSTNGSDPPPSSEREGRFEASPTRLGRDQERLQDTLTADIYRLIIPIAFVSIVAGAIRDWPDGPLWTLGIRLGLLVGLMCMHWARRRIPFLIRATILIGLVQFAGLLNLVFIGAYTPSALLLPSSVLLAWLFLGNRWAMIYSISSGLIIAISAVYHLSGQVKTSVSINSMPSTWIALTIALSMFLVLILLPLNRILTALHAREAELRREIGERVLAEQSLQLLNTQLEERVAERTEKLEKSRRSLQAFSYAVSHDLRTPLRAIHGFTKVVLEEDEKRLSEEGRSAIDRILAGSRRMDILIDALLGLSRIDTTKPDLVEVDMDALAREVRDELVQAEADRTESPVEWVLHPLPPCRTDAALVRQVWANLLSNASKFARLGPAPRVEWGAEEIEGHTWYYVKDNGPGFEMSQARKLFQMFTRLQDSSAEGLGIGLATVHRILEKLEGDIDVRSIRGIETVFRFRPTSLPSSRQQSSVPDPDGPSSSRTTPHEA
ncbi:MAG: hypothetical protein H6686_07880 [Fibrobacteria bacterium]|nr:hypothetical protein [Fibrobacteria bacterium]